VFHLLSVSTILDVLGLTLTHSFGFAGSLAVSLVGFLVFFTVVDFVVLLGSDGSAVSHLSVVFVLSGLDLLNNCFVIPILAHGIENATSSTHKSLQLGNSYF